MSTKSRTSRSHSNDEDNECRGTPFLLAGID
jgi:hypothetical protein